MIGTTTMRNIGYTLLLLLGPLACGDDLPNDIKEGDGPSMNCGTTSGECTSGTTTGDATPGTTDGTTTTGTTPPPSSSSSSDDGPNTVGIPDECTVTSDCPRGEFCVAEFIERFGPEGKQPNECVTQCVGIMDETKWCLDASACCDPLAECTDRGYCEYPEGSTGTGGDSGSGGEGSGGTSGGRG